jgi:hypothetical protein
MYVADRRGNPTLRRPTIGTFKECTIHCGIQRVKCREFSLGILENSLCKSSDEDSNKESCQLSQQVSPVARFVAFSGQSIPSCRLVLPTWGYKVPRKGTPQNSSNGGTASGSTLRRLFVLTRFKIGKMEH